MKNKYPYLQPDQTVHTHDVGPNIHQIAHRFLDLMGAIAFAKHRSKTESKTTISSESGLSR